MKPRIFILLPKRVKLTELSDRGVHFLNDDTVGLIPAGPSVTSIVAATTITNIEANFYFTYSQAATVALNVGRSVDV